MHKEEILKWNKRWHSLYNKPPKTTKYSPSEWSKKRLRKKLKLEKKRMQIIALSKNCVFEQEMLRLDLIEMIYALENTRVTFKLQKEDKFSFVDFIDPVANVYPPWRAPPIISDSDYIPSVDDYVIDSDYPVEAYLQ